MTVGRWRQHLRMLYSIRFLASGEKVLEVALAAGYESPSAFISAFRKILGTTPSQWREAPFARSHAFSKKLAFVHLIHYWTSPYIN